MEYDDKVYLSALTKQVSHGPLEQQRELPDIGYLDMFGHDRRFDVIVSNLAPCFSLTGAIHKKSVFTKRLLVSRQGCVIPLKHLRLHQKQKAKLSLSGIPLGFLCKLTLLSFVFNQCTKMFFSPQVALKNFQVFFANCLN